MKKIIKAVLCLGLLFTVSKESVMAALPIGVDKVINEKIETVPIIVTPTKIPIKIEKVIDIGDLKPLATKTPTTTATTPAVTTTTGPEKPTETPVATETVETENTTKISNTQETVSPQPTIEKIDKTKEDVEKTSSDKLFWGIIIGLLVLILAVQVWSTKNNEEKQTKTDNE